MDRSDRILAAGVAAYGPEMAFNLQRFRVLLSTSKAVRSSPDARDICAPVRKWSVSRHGASPMTLQFNFRRTEREFT